MSLQSASPTQTAPPRSRGWTRGRPDPRTPRAGSPALAGMDPRRMSRAPAAAWLPRARGDGPAASIAATAPSAAPPRSRGWTVGAAARRDVPGGSPALAGMDPASSSRQRPTAGLPRARGDGPGPRDAACWRASAPPRSRGWTPAHGVGLRGLVGSPALAGMDPRRSSTAWGWRWLPRARGDGPLPRDGVCRNLAAPPRSRGWTRPRAIEAAGVEGSPALAGMDPSTSSARRCPAGLPRARGDGPFRRRSRRRPCPAPPRSRGWTRSGTRRGCARSGSPALAGMDPTTRAAPCGSDGLPRARGDGPAEGIRFAATWSAPPRSRGWTRRLGRRFDDDVGSPALAGMDPTRSAVRRWGLGLPRARGDGPDTPRDGLLPREAPPRSRGWTLHHRDSPHRRRGSPALAGMDPRIHSVTRSCGRLPRARGDGPLGSPDELHITTAPPRSRGWTP